MRRSRLLAAAIISALALSALIGWSVPSPSTAQPATAPAPPKNPEESQINPPVANCNPNGPTMPIAPAILTGAVPCAPIVSGQGAFRDPLDNLQHGFDFYSWLTFVALNWPAEGGVPIGKGGGPGGDARTVWEDGNNFRQLADVMLANGERPVWGRRVVPEACRALDAPGRMIIHIEEETFDQPFKSGPLIDQNGNYALFDILMNKPMFDYIVENNLYSRQGQRSFSRGQEKLNGSSDAAVESPGVSGTPPPGLVNFPKGSQPSGGAAGTMGALMLKVSWRVLGSGEDASKFHGVTGLVFTERTATKPATCVEKKLGLIGFHAGHKTRASPQWVWTTFEHVDNAPEQNGVGGIGIQRRFSFYNPACSPLHCPVNQLVPRPWDPAIEPFPDGKRSQITRVIGLTDDTKKLNSDFQALTDTAANVGRIKGSVWENYMLVSTQWPTDARSATDPTGAPAPTYLANTTLETYSQGEIPLSASSCIACHNDATTHHVPATASDFTYILEKAK